ncbi:hypothetical protein MNBD_NITROSPIRAE01-1573 [hydrothermal vent metagenome]|uniref:Uncharacterized protein n=1 Tax=hydrothermal vent metagenome TaxID=652676 RepID=A0A3B1CDH3_9ZZZZ
MQQKVQAQAQKSPQSQRVQALQKKMQHCNGEPEALQRMAKFSGLETVVDVPLILERISAHGLVGEMDAIYGEVLSSKPSAIHQIPALEFLDIDQAYPELIREWHAYGDTVEYEDTPKGLEKLIKHAIKYHLHTKYQWQSIGEAEYMTGDATGLALAPIVDPRITVKILHGSQKKIVLDGTGQNTHPREILPKIKEYNLLSDLEVIYGEVLREFSSEANQHPGIKFFDIEAEFPALLEGGLIARWYQYALDETYDNDKAGYEAILKSIMTFYINREFSGVTGTKPKKLTIYQQDEFLPDYFRPAQSGGNIRHSNTDLKKKYAGTSDRYARKYNQVSGRGQVMPWNKETYAATKIIGREYRDEEKRARLQEQLLPAESDPKREGVQRYKERLDGVIKGKKCVFLWGRTSGAKGGAHTELDSHAEMMLQLAQTIHKTFSDRLLIVVGDDVISGEDLSEAGVRNQVMVLGEFWNDREFKSTFYGDRNAQRYLFQLFDEQNDAVSLGMRSGSLEGMAMLGLKVIFIDDKGNNAAGRMEFWAGGAADERAGTVKEGPEALARAEKEKEGPMANYKRIASYQKTGDRIEARKVLLQKAKRLLTRVLTEKDARGDPVYSEGGDERGIDITAPMAAYEGDILAEHLPEDPKVLEKFYTDFELCINKIESSGAWGRLAERVGSAFNFGRAEVRDVLLKLVLLEQSGAVSQAIILLKGLSGITDLLGLPIVSDKVTAGPATVLFKSFTGKSELSNKDAEYFNTMYERMSSQFQGKQKDAVAGKLKFRRGDIELLFCALPFLEKNNLLNQNELEQVKFLISYLSPN